MYFVITMQFQLFCSLMSACVGCPMAMFYSHKYINVFKGSLGKYLILGAPKKCNAFYDYFCLAGRFSLKFLNTFYT